MSTPLYIKETTLDKISNSRVSEGCALLFYLDGKLKMKFSDGTVKDATGGSDVGKFIITRPISDEQLYPKFEASSTSDFKSSISVDPFNTKSDIQYLQVFDGTNWIEFPENGLGTPYDRMEVSVDIEKFSELEQPYYIRYCWIDSEGTESNFRSTLFPSVSVGGSNSGEGGQVVVDNALAYEDIDILSNGYIVPVSGGFPIWIRTSLGNHYPIEKNSLILSGGYYQINPNPYLVYDNVNSFNGSWRIYFAGGVKGDNAITVAEPTVNTLNPESNATADANCDENGVVTFKFGIPKGEKGDKGEDGNDYKEDAKDILENRSNYDNELKGFCFLAIDEGNLYFKLSDNSGDWSDGKPITVGQKGEQGIQGEQGPKGEATVITIGDNGNWFLDGVDTNKKATGSGSNAVLSPTPPTDIYDGMIWIQVESQEDLQYVNFETIDVVVGNQEPTDAPDGTIFIQE